MEMRPQHNLGKFVSNSNKTDRSWNNGYLAIGKVSKVHHKRYTVDVQFKDHTKIVSSSEDNEGVNSCKVLTCSAGCGIFPYGVIEPIFEGDMVLVAFARNKENAPIVLGVLHDANEDVGALNPLNSLPSAYPVDSTIEQARFTRVFKPQDFFTIDGAGCFQLYSHTRAFLSASNRVEMDDETYDYFDLDVRDLDGNTIGLAEPDSKPMKFIGVIRKYWDAAKNDALRIIADAAKQVLRLAQINSTDSKLSTFAIEESGAVRVRRQQDKWKWTDNSDNYTDVAVESDGQVHVQIHKLEEQEDEHVTITDTGSSVIEPNCSSRSSKKRVVEEYDIPKITTYTLNSDISEEGNIEIDKLTKIEELSEPEKKVLTYNLHATVDTECNAQVQVSDTGGEKDHLISLQLTHDGKMNIVSDKARINMTDQSIELFVESKGISITSGGVAIIN